jgi:hypothetical protein
LDQPTELSQTCEVTSASGTVAGANVTDVTVTCSTDSFSIGGSVSGLDGSGLVLQNNSGDDLVITGNGPFTFDSDLLDGSDYLVTVLEQPTELSQTCEVTSASGTVAGANVANVSVNCVTDQFTIGGTVAGLDGEGLVLRNNGVDSLAVSSNGDFTFNNALPDGSAFEVTVLGQPSNLSQTCVVANGTGTLVGASVTDVLVTCSTDEFSVGGVVSGLQGNGLVLQNNEGDDLTINGNGEFSFTYGLPDGSAYEVTVLTQPTTPDQTCIVTDGSGTLAGADVTGVAVDCVAGIDLIFSDNFEQD